MYRIVQKMYIRLKHILNTIFSSRELYLSGLLAFEIKCIKIANFFYTITNSKLKPITIKSRFG